MPTSKDKINSIVVLTLEERLTLEQQHDILLLLEQLAKKRNHHH